MPHARELVLPGGKIQFVISLAADHLTHCAPEGDVPVVAYAQAKTAGAEMLFDLKEMGYGGKAFTCRDPEGHLWFLGTYNPWETTPKD